MQTVLEAGKRQSYIQAGSHADRHIDNQTVIQGEIHTGRQGNRQTGIKVGRQTDVHTCRHCYGQAGEHKSYR